MGPRSFERGKAVQPGLLDWGGPASMGPRSFERGKRPGRSWGRWCQMLQWGRVRLNAESADWTEATARVCSLQWGRVRLNAERTNKVMHTARVLGLQWGRVRLNAESREAAMGVATYLVLQWGRVRLNAERRHVRMAQLALARASMGPRSFERGKRLSCPAVVE